MNLSDFDEIWIFGSGSYSHRVLKLFELNHISVQGFIDFEDRVSNFESNSLFKYEKLEKLKKIVEQSKCLVIIGIHNPYADVYNIKMRLLALNYEVLLSTELQHLSLKHIELLENYMFVPQVLSYYDTPEILCDDAFDDEYSNALYHAICQYRLHGDPTGLEKFVDPQSLYFPNLEDWFDEHVALDFFIDAGAFDGDTMSAFLGKQYSIANWFAIEPNPMNFESLCEKSEAYRNRSDIHVLNNALWSSESELNIFFDELSPSSSVKEVENEKSITVKGISIDENFSLSGVGAIKMDIEGSELDALKGALMSICKLRPYLLLSVYHKKFDIEDIYNFLKSLDLNYKFYLRSHGFQSFDTVMYCVPNNN